MYLICGLGNPGSKYKCTLHNAGFLALNVLLDKFNASTSQKWNSELGDARHGTTKLLLQKPLTYMNRSGEAVGHAAMYYKIPPHKVIVLHDDIDLEFGRLKLKIGGSEGGHNGLRSITQHLGTREYLRVRIGVGRSGENAADYVLKPLTREVSEKLQIVVQNAAEATLDTIDIGLNKAQTKWHV